MFIVDEKFLNKYIPNTHEDLRELTELFEQSFMENFHGQDISLWLCWEKLCTAFGFQVEKNYFENFWLNFVNRIDKVTLTTPLYRAINRQHIAAVEFLLAHGADANQTSRLSRNYKQLDPDANDDELWEQAIKPKRPGVSTITPLQAAVLTQSPAIVQRLLTAGANKDANTPHFDHPLLLSLTHRLRDIFYLLFNTGSVPNIFVTTRGQSESLLHKAVQINDFDIVELLLKSGADANASSNTGTTPLYCAVLINNPVILKLLLKYDGRVNDILPFGQQETLLFIAIRKVDNDYRIAQILLENGANPNSQDKMLTTPLYYAAEKHDRTLIKLLMQYGADIELVRKTPAAFNFIDETLRAKPTLSLIDTPLENTTTVTAKLDVIEETQRYRHWLNQQISALPPRRFACACFQNAPTDRSLRFYLTQLQLNFEAYALQEIHAQVRKIAQRFPSLVLPTAPIETVKTPANMP